MAQRNPMNQRYQGDGPGGQTRKSAARAKPASQAAASVKVKGKPSTSAEKKAAEREQKERMQKKAAERQRKAARALQAQRTAEAKAKLARGEITAEEMEAETAEAAKDAKAAEKEAAKLSKATPPPADLTWQQAIRTNNQYKRWRRLYWVCFCVAIGMMVVTFFVQRIPDVPISMWVAPMVVSYLLVFVGIGIQMLKVRPLQDAYKKRTSNKLTPKQLKHQQEAQAKAEQVAAARAAEKAARSRPRKGAKASSGTDDA